MYTNNILVFNAGLTHMPDKKKPKRKKNKIQSFAFVDTNIFLDFYRQKDAHYSLIEKLGKPGVRDRIISTYQVEMEYLKNRQTEITKLLAQVFPDDNIKGFVPPLLRDQVNSKSHTKIKNEINKTQKNIERKIHAILGKPKANDKIFKVLSSIFESKAEHVLTRDMPERHLIKKRAMKRFFLGYPPRKNNDTSYGDAFNWEWIIHCSQQLRGKIIIVSKDSDYGTTFKKECYLNDQLHREFRDRVGRKSILFTNKLSEALEFLEVQVTEAEKKSESHQIEDTVVSHHSTKKFIDLADALDNLASKFTPPKIEIPEFKFNLPNWLHIDDSDK